MSEMFQSVLDQFKNVLDVSQVQPIFGVKGLFWMFLLIEAAVRVYLGHASRLLHEQEPTYRQDLVRRFWVKLLLLFLVLRPFLMASNPATGRANAFLLNIVLDLVLVVSAFLRLRYVKAEEARFAEWTEVDAPEGMMEEEGV